MTSPRDIRQSFVLAIASLALLLAAAVYFKSRMNDRETLAANRSEVAELRAVIAQQTQAFSELRSRLEQMNDNLGWLTPPSSPTSRSTPPFTPVELSRRFAELAALQSNLLAMIQRHAPLETVTESPEQTRQRAEAVITELESLYADQQKRIADAQAEVDTVRTNLAVPDDIAVMELDKAADDPRLSAYRTYFEAKRKRDELRQFGRILGMKLAAEKIDLSLPHSTPRVQP